RAGHNLQGIHARVAKQLVRNRASDAANSFLSEKSNNDLQWLETIKNVKKKENDAESDKRVSVEERHRGIERELDPKGQRSGTPIFSILGSLAKELFAPMPQQKHAGRNCVKQSALGD